MEVLCDRLLRPVLLREERSLLPRRESYVGAVEYSHMIHPLS